MLFSFSKPETEVPQFKTESPQGIFLPNYLAWTLTRPFGDCGDGDDDDGGDGVNLV